jgi:hypothetical protein
MRLLNAITLSLLAAGCSPVMEVNRPDPVDLSKFITGESRLKVIGELGGPLSSVKDGDRSCDMYNLYTRGPGSFGKSAIAAGEAAADVVTIGLAEVIFTPLEAATHNSKHTVMVCYQDDKLVSIKESETHVD